MKKSQKIYVCVAAVLFGAVLTAQAGAIKPKKAASVLNIQGYRVGMAVKEVKQLLEKKKVKNYQTVFSDLFVYDSSPQTEIKLFFACSARGQVLSTVKLSTMFTAAEAETVVPKFKERLIARYGMPLIRESQESILDFCWGQCGQGVKGTKLEAKTTSPEGNKKSLVLTLSNDDIEKKCEGVRPRKINKWLYEWISYVRKFTLGMSVKDASALYQKRYQDKLMTDEERDEAVQNHAVLTYVAKELDFFAGLDYESLAFSGKGPGTIVLKFTGDQAGNKSRLNKRLYYASFSTTKFSDSHGYSDVQQKLDKFVKAYGKPSDVFPVIDGVMAEWRQDAKKITVTIFDSGLITFEQSDPSLKDAYRDQAIKKIEEFNKTRFDRSFF